MIINVFSNSLGVDQKWIILGVPVIFIFGSVMHFVYGWSGKKAIIGAFVPVNESVWEHLKMAFWPILLWWVLGYCILKQNSYFQIDKWFVACTTSIVTALITIKAIYYTYTGALGFKSLIIDILSFFVGIGLGQLLALHIYNYAELGSLAMFYSFVVLAILALAFIAFTFCPPRLPIFKDSITGKYGIYHFK